MSDLSVSGSRLKPFESLSPPPASLDKAKTTTEELLSGIAAPAELEAVAPPLRPSPESPADRMGGLPGGAAEQHQRIAADRKLENRFEAAAEASRSKYAAGFARLKDILEGKTPLKLESGAEVKLDGAAVNVARQGEADPGGSVPRQELNVGLEGVSVKKSSTKPLGSESLTRSASVGLDADGARLGGETKREAADGAPASAVDKIRSGSLAVRGDQIKFEAGAKNKNVDGTMENAVNGSLALRKDGFEAGASISAKDSDGIKTKVSGTLGADASKNFDYRSVPGQCLITMTRSLDASVGVSSSREKEAGLSRGFGLKFGFEGKTTYQTSLGKAEAETLEKEDKAPELPDFLKVRSGKDVLGELKVGDKLTYESGGCVEASVSGTYGAASASVKAVMQGQFRTEVERLPGDRVRVLVQPTDLKSVSVAVGDSIGLVEVSGNLKVMDSLTQEFIFDLGNERGRLAYQDALRGRLPAGYGAQALEGGAGDVARRLSSDPAEAGYVATRLGRTRFEGWGGGVATLLAGASTSQGARASREVGFERDASGKLLAVSVDDGSLESRQDKAWTPWSGTQARDWSADLSVKTSRNVATGQERQEVIGLNLEQRLADSATDSKDMQALLGRAREATGLERFSGPPPASRDWGGAELSLRAKLTPEHLKKLEQLKEGEIKQIQGLDGEQKKKLLELATLIQGTGSRRDSFERQKARMEILRDKISSDMGAWMGILNKAAGLDVQFSSSSAQITQPIQNAQAFMEEFSSVLPYSPRAFQDAPQESVEGYFRIPEVLRALGKAEARIAEDPLLDASEKRQLRGQVQGLGRELEALRSSATGLDLRSQGMLLEKLASGHGSLDENKLALQFMEQLGPQRLAHVVRAMDVGVAGTPTPAMAKELLGTALKLKDRAMMEQVWKWNPVLIRQEAQRLWGGFSPEEQAFLKPFAQKRW